MEQRFVDIHCHVLPGVDDGAQNIEETRRMLQTAYDEGIRYIIATPHHHPIRGKQPPRVLRKQLKIVREEAEKISPKLRVFLGTEVYFGQDVPERLKKEKILTMNRTNTVLLEFSHSDEYEHICRGIQQVQMHGFEVILAHIERYPDMLDKIEEVRHLVDMGVMIQINAGSILGQTGRSAKKFVKQLLDERLVFCVGTDAHDPVRRAPKMQKAVEYVVKKYGEEYARRIFFSNAASLLRNKKKRDESK